MPERKLLQTRQPAPGLARLCIEQDEDGDVWRYTLPACARQLGGSLRHLHLVTAAVEPLPLRHLGALSGLTSLRLGSLRCDDTPGGEWGDSDSGGDEHEGGGTARAEEAAWACGAAGPLLPELRQLVLFGVRALPPAFSALTALTQLQLGVEAGSSAAAVPEFVWRLQHLKVRAAGGWGVSTATGKPTWWLAVQQPYRQPGCRRCCHWLRCRPRPYP